MKSEQENSAANALANFLETTQQEIRSAFKEYFLPAAWLINWLAQLSKQPKK